MENTQSTKASLHNDAQGAASGCSTQTGTNSGICLADCPWIPAPNVIQDVWDLLSSQAPESLSRAHAPRDLVDVWNSSQSFSGTSKYFVSELEWIDGFVVPEETQPTRDVHVLNGQQNVTEATYQLCTESNHQIVANQHQPIHFAYERSKHSSSRKTQRTRLLSAWFSAHQEYPYPTHKDVSCLSRQSGLSTTQVTNWFTNARRSHRIPPLRRSSYNDSRYPAPRMISGMPQALPSLRRNTTPEDDRPSSSAIAGKSVLSTGRIPPKTTYQCRFCRISLKKNHDLIRHERSVHMPHLDTYICTMFHGRCDYNLLKIWQTKRVVLKCALCGHPSPDELHYKSHNFETCSERPVGQRTFSRKDHFWQHLCKYHNCRKWEGWALNLDFWRQRNGDVGASCGFCGIWLDSWDKRKIHVEHHFKMGMQIDNWASEKDVKMPLE